jgi:3-oxoadipate enol-lactonase
MLLQIDKRNFHYDLVGPEDAPVVCMTHCLSSDGGVWAEQVPALLANNWRVLRLDMRGHGGSDANVGAPAMADFSDDVAKLLDALAIRQVHYIGLSIGGMYGQTFALDHPERLRSLMLCSTSPMAVPGGDQMWFDRFDQVNAAGSVEPVADASMERWVTPAFEAQRPVRYMQIRETISRTSIPGYIAAAKAVMKFDVRSRLPTIKTPTIVHCGADDPGTPPEGNKLIASLIPGARYFETENGRHLANVEWPEKFNPIMLNWLSARR